MSTPDLDTLRGRLAAMEDAAVAVLLERNVEVACVIAALLARQHVFFLSAPGTAKTFLGRVMVALIDGLGPRDYFSAELNRSSVPDELLGPHDPLAFRVGRYERNVTGMLPEARVARVGEIWKAPAGTTLSLLSVLNERLLYNGRDTLRCPLSTLICDSNETPEDSSDHQPIWDRILLRARMTPLAGRGNFTTVVRQAVERRRAVGSATEPDVEPVVSWADIEAAQAAVRAVALGDDVYDALWQLRTQLAGMGIFPSDRRMVEATSIIQATAFRAGRAVATARDTRLLAHVLWTRHVDAPKVHRLVYGLVSPLDTKVLAINDDADALEREMESVRRIDDVNTRRLRAAELGHRSKALAQNLLDIRRMADDEGIRLADYAAVSARVTALGRANRMLLA